MAIINNTIINGKLYVNGNINASVVTAGSFVGAFTGTATNASSLNGKAESALSVSYATTAGTASNATSLNSKAESALSVSYATTAGTAGSATSAKSATTAGVATSVKVQNVSQTTSYLLMATACTGACLNVYANTGVKYDPANTVLIATKFSGSFSGNATSATTAASLTTARYLTIADNNSHSGASIAFKGNANVTISLPTTINANNFTVSKAINISYNSTSDCLEVVFL